jgi:hypothetical protein
MGRVHPSHGFGSSFLRGRKGNARLTNSSMHSFTVHVIRLTIPSDATIALSLGRPDYSPPPSLGLVNPRNNNA